jgi:hypothetical protein
MAPEPFTRWLSSSTRNQFYLEHVSARDIKAQIYRFIPKNISCNDCDGIAIFAPSILTMTSLRPLKTFIVYSNADRDLKLELERHLRALVDLRWLELWSDRERRKNQGGACRASEVYRIPGNRMTMLWILLPKIRSFFDIQKVF